MSKLIIVFCLAVFASANYAATLEKRQNDTLQAAKDKCIRSIHRTFDELKKSYEETAEDNNPEADRLALEDGLIEINELIKMVNESELIDVMENTYIFTDIPVFCDNETVYSLDDIILDLLGVTD